jgi:tetratricopeptide (TPR) repeat protein
MRTPFVFLISLGLAMAQHHAAPAPEKPVTLYKGLGAWRHPIATRSPEAQKFFDQGLALLYGFNRYESLRSFRKASELDPQAAMTFWGMAMAQGPYINMDGDPSYDLKSACMAIDAGRKLTGAPEHEKAYLAAVATWCGDSRPAAYTAAMRAVAASYPDDLDALTIYAESLMIPTRWHWYAADGKPAEGVADAERTLEQVLRRWPDHVGANHYYIHAVESSPAPERAIQASLKLMGQVSGMGHLVHMPGHIWLVLGDWETAVDVNTRAVAADREYFAATNVTGTYYPYFLHNLDFIRYARLMQGRKADAFRAAETMSADAAPMVQVMPEMSEQIFPAVLFTHLRFGDWDYIMKSPQPGEKLKVSTAVWHLARTVALAGRGDRAGAAHERDAFESAKTSVPADSSWGQNKTADVFAMASEILAARVAGSPQEAVKYWQRAVSLQDGLTYDEPPAWYYPLRESLGAALLRAGQPAEAEKVFRDGVKRSPRNGRMLFGLMESLQAQNKTEAAGEVKREFDAVWAKADVKLRLEDL